MRLGGQGGQLSIWAVSAQERRGPSHRGQGRGQAAAAEWGLACALLYIMVGI